MRARAQARPVTLAALRAWPLPRPPSDGDKEARGHVFVVGGSRETPGAIILAAVAALRAGAGKLTIVTVRSVATSVAVAVPEARVIGLPETRKGELGIAGALKLELDTPDAVLVGPGMSDEAATTHFVRALLRQVGRATVILDAGALSVTRTKHGPKPLFAQAPILTPHAGEMAGLCGRTKSTIEVDPFRAALDWASRCNAIVVLKGPSTYIAASPMRSWVHEGKNVGLAMSGSGDVLAGIVAGLAARGATPVQAAIWGVASHARAAALLSRRVGPLGYIARELSGVLPEVLAGITHR